MENLKVNTISAISALFAQLHENEIEICCRIRCEQSAGTFFGQDSMRDFAAVVKVDGNKLSRMASTGRILMECVGLTEKELSGRDFATLQYSKVALLAPCFDKDGNSKVPDHSPRKILGKAQKLSKADLVVWLKSVTVGRSSRKPDEPETDGASGSTDGSTPATPVATVEILKADWLKIAEFLKNAAEDAGDDTRKLINQILNRYKTK
jgi:hypothetical protein